MDKYKKSIKTRMALCAAATFIISVIIVFDTFDITKELIGSSYNSHMIEFQNGLLVAVELLCVYLIFRYSQCIKDDKKLKLLYNNEHDERMKMIKSKAGLPMIQITSIIMVVCGVIAGYFSDIIFMTLIIAALIQMIICKVVKIVCTKTM